MKKNELIKLWWYFLGSLVTFYLGLFIYNTYFLVSTPVYIDPNSQFAHLKDTNSLYTGEYKEYYPDSKRIHTTWYFQNGKRHGEFKMFFPNKKLNVLSYYKDGILEGKFEIYDEKWILREKSFYKEGIIQWEVSHYHDTGKLYYIEKYIDGKKEGEVIMYFPDGSIMSKVFYKNGEKDGQELIYLEWWALVHDYWYKNGKLIKWEAYYSENKKLRLKTEYIESLDDYKVIEYDMNGKIISGNNMDVQNIKKPPVDASLTPQWAEIIPWTQILEVSSTGTTLTGE